MTHSDGVYRRLIKSSVKGVNMEKLKEVFGEEPLTYEDFEKKVNEKGLKLADLSTGEYVSKDKFQNTSQQIKEKEKEIEELNNKYSEVSKKAEEKEKLEEELQQLQNEKKRVERESLLKDQGVDERYRKFVLTEINEKLNEDDNKDKKFEDVAKEYLEENDQFIASKENETKGSIFKKASSPRLDDGEGGKSESINEKMNKIIKKGRSN